MALTDAQRSKVRFYLGWSSRWTDVNSRLESAMDSLSSSEDETRVTDALTQCDAIKAKLDALASDCAKVVQVDGIQLRSAYALQTLRSLGRQEAGSISKILGVPMKDGGYFAATGSSTSLGPMGDGFSRGGWPKYG